MPKQEFPFPMPNGWFCISRSHELKVGEVQSLKFCEKDVVAFRTENGTPAVLDAFCPHLGAHLGEGGCVRCLLYTSPSPRDATLSRMPSSA